MRHPDVSYADDRAYAARQDATQRIIKGRTQTNDGVMTSAVNQTRSTAAE